MMKRTGKLRESALAVGITLSLAGAGCERDAPPPAPAVAATTESAPVASADAAPGATPSAASANPCGAPGSPGCGAPSTERAPFAPPPDDRPSGAPPSEKAPADAPKTQIGTIKDWVRNYNGSGVPDTNEPPRLALLSDLPNLPKSTLLYTRSGRIVRVDLPSGVEMHLTGAGYASRSARWTRDGSSIFFVSNREGAVDKIFRMAAGGGDAAPVTRGLRTVPPFEWDISDDGARVAYIAQGQGDDQELHVVDVASGRDDVVYRYIQLSYPSFSRDKKTLLFVQGYWNAPRKDIADPTMIVAMDLASRVVKTLPNAGYAEISSLRDVGDGRLLFAASIDLSMSGRAPRLFTMPIGGGAWSEVGDFPVPTGYLGAAPSPDRKTLAIAWSARQGGFGADWISNVGVMPIEGGAVKAFTKDFPRPFYGAGSPSWAPDGRHLAFVLRLCPTSECEPNMNSVVLVDTKAPSPKHAFVGYGTSPAFRPAP